MLQDATVRDYIVVDRHMRKHIYKSHLVCVAKLLFFLSICYFCLHKQNYD